MPSASVVSAIMKRCTPDRPLAASIASKCELSCRALAGATRDSTMASDAARSLASCSNSHTAASA